MLVESRVGVGTYKRWPVRMCAPTGQVAVCVPAQKMLQWFVSCLEGETVCALYDALAYSSAKPTLLEGTLWVGG